MAQVVIIIGNGFDLDLGLKTRYSDFMKSREFEYIYDEFSGTNPSTSLIDYLYKKSKLKNWFDMEEAIHDFVSNDVTFCDFELVNNEFEFPKLKSALCSYLKKISTDFQLHENKLPVIFLYNMKFCYQTIAEIYFNYTNPRCFLKVPKDCYPPKYTSTYVHGSLEENNIVLGCDIQPGEKVNRNLSFMYKYNMLKRANHIARNLMEATEIIFYGHSVNEMDFCYFREFFKAASASPLPPRHLTIITLDEKSERDIKDNIRNQGISVSDLYSNLETFEFIHTSKIYQNEEAEIKKWNNMWRRLLGDDNAKKANLYLEIPNVKT